MPIYFLFNLKASSPACSELETIVVNWIGKALGLPNHFLALTKDSLGGGVIQVCIKFYESNKLSDRLKKCWEFFKISQNIVCSIQSSASESVLVSMLAARSEAMKRLQRKYPDVDEAHLLSKLIAYCSAEAHSCVEKAAMIAFVKIRILEADEDLSLNPNTLTQAMESDMSDGLVPFFVSATLGSTSACGFDHVEEIGIALKKYPNVWLHVDAAYAGCAFICPELRPLMKVRFFIDAEFSLEFVTIKRCE